MGYCFMRIEPVQSYTELTARGRHNMREYTPPNTDPSLSYLNETLVPLEAKNYAEASKKETTAAIKSGKMKSVRKNAILGAEIIVKCPREDLAHVDIEAWKKDNLAWAEKIFGKNNIKHAIYHADEPGNVHMHILAVPMDEHGRLNYSHFIDGPRFMRGLQTDYGDLMHEKHGLIRGEIYSTAKFKDIHKLYTSVLDAKVTAADIQPLDSEMDGERILPCYVERVAEKLETANFQHLSKEADLKRQLEVAQTHNLQDDIGLMQLKEKYKKELKKLEDLKIITKEQIKKNDISVKEYTKALNTMRALTNGLKAYPDQAYAKETGKRMDQIIAYERAQEKEKEKEIERTFQ